MLGGKKLDVVVVGAGPVGLFAALVLAKRGIHVQIVDKEWRTGARSCAIALHGQSLRLLEDAGLLPEILELGYPISKIGFYDAAGQLLEARLAGNGKRPPLLALRQDLLESLLEEALASWGVHVKWNHRVSGIDCQTNKVVVTIDKLEQDSVGYGIAHTEWIVTGSKIREAAMVIGADGHRSFVRRMAKIDFVEVGPAQSYAAFDLKSVANLENEMRIVIGPHTTDTLWPLSDGYCRWMFELPGVDLREERRQKDRVATSVSGSPFAVLSEDGCRKLLAERAPWFTGVIREIAWRDVVRFEHRLAECFGRQRIGLAGDSAHLTGPVGMQSMNVGFREARDLADVVSDVLHGAEPARSLDAYHARSLARWRRLMGLDHDLVCREGAPEWVCNAKNRLPSCIPAYDEDFDAIAQQLGMETAVAVV